MSQPDPFDPADTPHAPPPLPVRVQPFGGPMSVLPYTQPATNARPGLVTAIGVASLVIGVIAMLGGAFTTLISASFFIASSATPRNFSALADPMGPNGYDSSDRRTIVQAMNLKQKMTTAQRSQLDFFIADVGKLYVPSVPIISPTNDPVADWGAANLTNSGAGVEGGDWFDLPMGKLTVTDKSASIQLSDGKTISRSTVRKIPNAPVLTPQEVGAAVNRMQEMDTTVTLSASQLSALTTALQGSSNQLFGAPRDMPTLLSQINSVSSNAGTTYVSFVNGGIVTVPSSGAATVMPGGIVNTGSSPFKLASAPAAVVVIENILSVCLSIYLLVIGILTLRNSPAGGKLHKVYAWAKLLLAVTGAGGLFWLILGSGGTAPWAWVSGVTVLVIGIIYPIVLLLVLPTRSLREWYSVEHVNH